MVATETPIDERGTPDVMPVTNILLATGRVAVIAVAVTYWNKRGASTSVASVTLLWATVSAYARRRPLGRLLPLCEHHIVVAVGTISFAIIGRECPSASCNQYAWLVGECMGGLVVATRAADKSSKSSPNLKPVSIPQINAWSHEREFAAKQFQAAFRPGVGALFVAILMQTVMFLADLVMSQSGPVGSALSITISTNVRSAGSGELVLAVVLATYVVGIGLRVWLHMLEDQQRACVLGGRFAVALAAIHEGGCFWVRLASEHVSPESSSASFLCGCLTDLVVFPYMGYSALPVAHRRAVSYRLSIPGPLAYGFPRLDCSC
jgi:hypothetical protein